MPLGPLGAKCQLSSQMKSQLPVSKSVKHCLVFSYVFSAHLPEETCFQQAGSSAVEGTSQALLGSSDQRMVPASLSLFLKSEKLPALKRTQVQALPWFSTYSLGLPASGTHLKSRKGLYSGPSPVQNSIHILYMRWVPQKKAVLGKWKENTL